MSVLIGKDTKVLVQGITGSAGSFHSRQCIAYGTQIVAGCTPGRGGEKFEAEDANGKRVEVPVYDTVGEAGKATGATVSCIFVPPLGAADAILEAIDAGCELVIPITEGVPVMDMIRVRRKLEGSKTVMVGPNCPGVITPGACKIGIMPGHIHMPGKIGVVSRSGTLTYEAVGQLTHLGLGQSTAIGIGGDPARGMGFIDCLKLFNDDPGTEAGMMMGEIGLHRGHLGSSRKAHGSRWRDHQRGQGHSQRQDRSAGSSWREGRPHPCGNGCDAQEPALS